MGERLQTCKPSRHITNTKVNSAFHPFRVSKSSTGTVYVRLGLRRDAFTCVKWMLTLCDPIWQMTLRSSVMWFLLGATHHLCLYTFTFLLTAGGLRVAVGVSEMRCCMPDKQTEVVDICYMSKRLFLTSRLFIFRFSLYRCYYTGCALHHLCLFVCLSVYLVVSGGLNLRKETSRKRGCSAKLEEYLLSYSLISLNVRNSVNYGYFDKM